MPHFSPILNKQEGLLLGQAIGDTLGGQVEFASAREIHRLFPDGVRTIQGGGPWNLIPGQVTDDTEMAYCLAHALIEAQGFDSKVVMKWYRKWQHSGPFDCGNTTRRGLQGTPLLGSEANGALMRISPLAIAGQSWEDERLMNAAMDDALLTHPNPVCQHANALFAVLLKRCLSTSKGALELLEQLKTDALSLSGEDSLLLNAMTLAENKQRYPIATFQEGWVVYAFHNALYQFLHAPSFEEALVDTINQGGDTDTTAAICGALMGAFLGRDNIPETWIEATLACESGERSGATHARPDFLWPSQTLNLAYELHKISNPPKEMVQLKNGNEFHST